MTNGLEKAKKLTKAAGQKHDSLDALIERLERYACSWTVGDAESEQRATDMDRAADELRHLTQSGIIEVAIRNPSVMEYMEHWEGRATKAESALQSLDTGGGEA